MSAYPTASSLQSSPPFMKGPNGQSLGLKSTERVDMLNNLRFLKEGASRNYLKPGTRDDFYDKVEQKDESLTPSLVSKYQTNESLNDYKLRYSRHFAQFR